MNNFGRAVLAVGLSAVMTFTGPECFFQSGVEPVSVYAAEEKAVQSKIAATLQMMRSSHVSSFHAQRIPRSSARVKISRNPMPPSTSVFPILPSITRVTSILYLYEIPKSPCSALPAQRIYCTEMGSFSPNFSSAHTLSSGVIFSTRSP